MWDQLTTFWSLDRAEKHYSLKEQPLNMPLGSQNPYAERAYCCEGLGLGLGPARARAGWGWGWGDSLLNKQDRLF